jgi:aspartate kinase
VSFHPTIMKFGGTSVQDAEAFRRVVEIVESQRGRMPVVVVSAMSGVTNALLKSVEMAVGGDSKGAVDSLDEQFERHRSVGHSFLRPEAAELFDEALDKARAQIAQLLTIAGSSIDFDFGGLQDAVVSFGEQLSSALLTEVMKAEGLPACNVDARQCIITDSEHGRANPNFELIAQRTRSRIGAVLAAGEIPVLGGFIASSKEGTTTTLGRGGSDYSAAILATPLEAREIQIWTDVTGVLTADPRVVKSAKTIPCLSYSEAAELAYFGAKVLHPKTIQPAIEQSIPVRICNSSAPADEGTLVVAESESSPQTVKAIAHKMNVTTVQITSARMLGAYGFLRTIFEIFDRHRTVVDVVTTSEVSVSLSLDDTRELESIVGELQHIGDVSIEEGRAIICVVGEGLRTTPGIAGKIFSTLSDINVSLISQGASRINLTFAVDQQRAAETVNRLHEVFFA